MGCDLQLDSEKKIDRCGVCGGQGTTCARDIFIWKEVPLSQCSVQCGGGNMMAHSVCFNNITKTSVEDGLCDRGRKPAARMAPCNNKPCPARCVKLHIRF